MEAIVEAIVPTFYLETLVPKKLILGFVQITCIIHRPSVAVLKWYNNLIGRV